MQRLFVPSLTCDLHLDWLVSQQLAVHLFHGFLRVLRLLERLPWAGFSYHEREAVLHEHLVDLPKAFELLLYILLLQSVRQIANEYLMLVPFWRCRH